MLRKYESPLSLVQQVALVLVRFAIGWHLFYQGLSKFWTIGWSAKGYLENSQGWMAPLFKAIAASPELLAIADQATIWTLMISGFCLMVGLFSTILAIAGSFLLLLFHLAGPELLYQGFTVPTSQGTELYIGTTLIEALSLLLIATFPTGQIAGLDILFVKRTRRDWFFGR